MHLHIAHVRQTSGPGYVVKYDAEVVRTPGDPRVAADVLSTVPEDADPSLVAEAAEAIRSGAESALRVRGGGAILRLTRLFIHEVDFSSMMFERITAEELSRALEPDA